jgi:hypothetical protein
MDCAEPERQASEATECQAQPAGHVTLLVQAQAEASESLDETINHAVDLAETISAARTSCTLDSLTNSYCNSPKISSI